MPRSSLYGPDRSLLIAIVLLGGGSLFAAGAVYVVTSFMNEFDLSPARQPAIAQAEGAPNWGRLHPQHPPSLPSTRRSTRTQTRAGSLPGFAAPTLPNPPTPRVPVRGFHAPPSPAYELDVDLSHAELPAPSAPSSGLPAAGPTSTPPHPATNSAHASVDVMGSPTGSGGNWRSELSQVEGRLQALSRTLADAAANQSGSSNPKEPSSGSGFSSTATTRANARSNNSPPSVPGQPPQVPIDGGLGWLAAAGAAYAARRLHQQSSNDA